MTKQSTCITAVVSVLLSACGGGGDGSGGATANPAPTNASPGGVWVRSAAPGVPGITGLVTETGEFHFLRDDGVQFFGTLSTSGNSVSGSLTGVTPIGFVFPGGSTTGTGTFSGTVQARTSLTGTVNFTTSGTTDVSNISYTFDPIYNRTSSLATIAGNYRDPSTNAVVNVNSNGVIFSQDAVTGCVINGTVSIINSSYNAYRVEYTFSSCRGLQANLNGTTARGLGAIDNTVAPEQVIIGVVNGQAGYSLVGRFPRI